jgi:hypothetical protein
MIISIISVTAMAVTAISIVAGLTALAIMVHKNMKDE